jgi:methionyl-tRNA formyltransferase
MKLDAGLDTGPVYCAAELAIDPHEDCGSLSARLSQLGAQMLTEKLPLILQGQLSPVRQSNDGVTYAEKWETEDLQIDWKEPALTTVLRVRASSPEQGARTTFRGELVKIFATSVAQAASGKDVAPGVIVESNRIELIVAAGNGSFVRISEMQFPGKRRMSVAEILRGKSISAGEHFE